jgi:hypothetical protein
MASNLTVYDHTKTTSDLQSTTKIIPHRNATNVHAQDFMANDKRLVPILKAHIPAAHSALTHCTLLELLDVFSLCHSSCMSVTPTNSIPPLPHTSAAMYTLLILNLSVFLHLSDSIGIHCRPDSSGFKHQQRQDFPHMSRPAPRHTLPPVQGTGTFSQR